MESNPKENPNQEETQKGLPKGDTPPVVDGSDNPVDKQKDPSDSSGGAKQPPGQNDSLSGPKGSNGKNNKWTKYDTLKILPIFISFLGLIGTIWALTNTSATLRATQKQFELINEPNLEIRDATLRFDVNGGISIAYNLWNLGTHIVNEIGKTDTLIYVKKENVGAFLSAPFANIDTMHYHHYSSDYFSHEKATREFRYEDVDTALLTKFIEENANIYFICIYEYHNPITGMNRKFRCVINLVPYNFVRPQERNVLKYIGTGYNYVLIQNYDVKQK
jgi:hypothetical protein